MDPATEVGEVLTTDLVQTLQVDYYAFHVGASTEEICEQSGGANKPFGWNLELCFVLLIQSKEGHFKQIVAERH